ncbi:restriction endonuclease subunit S [Acinetobacter seifertii]|uniref:Restriction endonuclease subunit S n=1 Tax=Acinetobacter seifertii TaxID=1530123 RepID=A0A7H2Q8U4_9GAMM|nr:restriction endonuclease subunit S [Acinetobacter seifertii]QNX11527.1 restriction endonuclease subunit S [Acinetobacter seifertii]QNX20611.1 restriction endonuclease subunit S [Acinetobacter seifertii]QNX38232.1 restriction endonuclease subunit S [Acinetobacter seifertii]QNX80766.1 restriction endonuclease subunit S [Acinetobacter seifertii]QNX92046.1 restriction endonuclease subunit S [Acinetobacter seifertii]
MKTIGEIASKVGSGSTPRGGAEAYTNEGVIFIRSQNVNNNQLLLDDVVFIPEATHKKMSGSKVQANDILLNITGASIGRSCVVSTTFVEGNVNQHVCIIRTPNDNPIFVQSFLSSEKGQNHIQAKQVGGGREGLNFQAIRSIDFEIPSKEEQTKIASFLSAVDEKIAQLTQKHELLSEYKQGMMQKLFSQQIRFKADDGSEFGEWENKTLGDITKLVSRRNKSDIDAEIYSVTNSQGFVKQNEYFEDRRIAGEDTSSYKIIKRNEFAYNPARINVGSIALFNAAEIGIISSLYVCFSVNENTKISFLEYFLKLDSTIKNYGLYGEGGVRIYLWYPLFSKIPFNIPCLEEQTKITNFLSAIDQKIEVVVQQIEQAKQWKKGLLQQMFV